MVVANRKNLIPQAGRIYRTIEVGWLLVSDGSGSCIPSPSNSPKPAWFAFVYILNDMESH
jgi:hypothetical protein